MAPPYPLALAHFPAQRQSLLARFADCGLSAGYELATSLARPDGRTLHTSGHTTHRQGAGRLIHATIARALRHMLDHHEERIPPETVIDLWDDELRQADVPLAETFALPAHEDALARRTLRKWARDNAFTIADVEAGGIEERLTAVVRYPGAEPGEVVERTITGQLDLLLIDDSGRHATVVDWKDTWKLPAKRGHDEEYDDDEEEDEGDDRLSLEGYFQQRFYALLVLRRYLGVQSVTLREFYVRRSRPREATLWRHQLPELDAYFGALAERFDRCYEAAAATAGGRRRRRLLVTPAQWGEPSPGAHCMNCAKAADCPVDRDVRARGAITDAIEAEQAAGFLLRLRSVTKRVEGSLRTWADREGPTRVRDAKRESYIGYVEAERTARPSRQQVETAMLAGRDPRRLFRRTVQTRFTTYTPDEDVTVGLSDDDVVGMFEGAADAAKRRRGRRRTTA